MFLSKRMNKIANRFILLMILSGLLLALMGYTCTGFTEELGITTDYSDNLQEYCHAVAALNNIASSSTGLREARSSTYLVMCRTIGQDVPFFVTKPSQIVRGPENRFVLVYESWEKADKAVVWLQSQSKVRYAEHDSTVTASAEGNETISFRSQGATQLNLGGFLQLAQRYGTGSQTVAVIDSGVSNHSLLSGRMKLKGYDYVDADADPTNDLTGHGTHVAGIIADCTADTPIWIYPIRVLNSVGTGQMSNVVSAVLEATEANVDVINLSLESFEMSEALDDAIESAENQGVIVVIAAGNHSCDTSGVCPAHLTGEGIIVVGSAETSETGYHRADYSNYGKSVDLYAFGTNINSCSRSGGYVVQSGTSMAAAHISGVCALMGLTHPGLSPQTIEKRLKSVCRGTEIRVLDTIGFVPVFEGFCLNSIVLCMGDSLQLPIVAMPITSYATIKWNSTDDNLLSIDDNGCLRANNPGIVEITANCLGFADSHIAVTVSSGDGETVSLPASLTHIDDDAFMGTGVKHIVLPESIESIGNKAFSECVYLQTIEFPGNVTEIGENILDGSEQTVILCSSNSTVHEYAKEHRLQFILTEE